MAQLNFFEKAISSLNPKFGVQRLADKCKLTELTRFAGAYPSRDRLPSRPLSGGESYYSTFERLQLIRAGRELEDNNPIVRSILLKFSQYALGNFRYMARTGDRTIDQAYEDYWASWCKRCDYFGRHNFESLSHLALRSVLRDGDVGFVITREKSIGDQIDPNSEIRIQAVEADRIGGMFDNPVSSQSYIGGVGFDEHGRTKYYKVYRRTQGNFYTDEQEVPASSFLLIYDPIRLDEVRGRSHLASVVNYCKDLHETMEAENLAVKNAAFRILTISNASGVSDDSASYFNQAQTDSYGNSMNIENMQKGQINYMPTGSEMKMFESNRPSSAFQGYVDLIVHMIALAFNLPFGFCYDLSKLGGPTVRLEMALASRTFKRWQGILEARFFDKIKNLVIADGISRGKIPANSNFTKGKWIYPSDTTIDVGRDSQANISEFKAGLRTASEIYGAKGEDYEEAMRQRAYEVKYANDLAEEFGIPAESISDAFKQVAPAPSAEGAVPPEMPAQDGQGEAQPQAQGVVTEIPSLNGAQVSSLINVMNAVSIGAISRDGAVAIITSAFPTISAEQAGQIMAGVSIGTTIPTAKIEVPQAGAEEKPKEESDVPARARRTQLSPSFSIRDAEMVLDALEMQSVKDVDLRATDGMIDSAKSAMRVRAEKSVSDRGMTQVGIARARDIIGKKNLSPRTWRRMLAFFSRHEVDKKGSSWDEQGKGWQAWNGWGGDAGFSRAKKVVEQLNKIRDGE
jgi:lambda family phage portal protein